MLKSKLLLSATVLGMGLGIAGMSNTAEAAEIEVQSGDTLSLIAEKHNTTVDNLVQLNGIQNANLIYVGETLITDASDVAAGGQIIQTAPVAQVETAPVVEAAPAQESAPTYSEATASGDNWHRANRRMVESTNNYNIGSANGYIGAYQFAPSTWSSIAASIGANPNDYSAANQDRIADAYANSKYGGWENVPTTGGW